MLAFKSPHRQRCHPGTCVGEGAIRDHLPYQDCPSIYISRFRLEVSINTFQHCRLPSTRWTWPIVIINNKKLQYTNMFLQTMLSFKMFSLCLLYQQKFQNIKTVSPWSPAIRSRASWAWPGRHRPRTCPCARRSSCKHTIWDTMTSNLLHRETASRRRNKTIWHSK